VDVDFVVFSIDRLLKEGLLEFVALDDDVFIILRNLVVLVNDVCLARI
jgi:hypothetical protein